MNASTGFQGAQTINNKTRSRILSIEEEYGLAISYKYYGDEAAGHKIVVAHMLLARSMAKKFSAGDQQRRKELESAAFLALSKAIRRFDPDKESKGKKIRFSTYAMFWIRAETQSLRMNDHSLVKVSTSSTNKQLFFKLPKAIDRLKRDNPMLPDDEIMALAAEELGVPEEKILETLMRLQPNISLNVKVRGDDGDSNSEFIDLQSAGAYIEDHHVEAIIDEDRQQERRQLVVDAFNVLNERQQDIFLRRRLQDPPDTLEVLGQKYGVSPQRIHQIEVAAFEKLQGRVKSLTA